MFMNFCGRGRDTLKVLSTAQKMKFSITGFFSKCDQICSFRSFTPCSSVSIVNFEHVNASWIKSKVQEDIKLEQSMKNR